MFSSACKRNNIDIICVVLGADTKNFRTSDSIKLINYIFENFETVNIKNLIDENFKTWKNENLDKFIINKGITQNLELEIQNIDNPIIPVRKDLIDSINISIKYQTYFDAPLHEKEIIGTIQTRISENTILNYKIYNSSEIKHKSWYMYLFDLFKNYSYIIENNLI